MNEDPESVKEIRALIRKMSEGDFNAVIDTFTRRDGMDSIGVELSHLAKTLKNQIAHAKERERKVDKLLEILSRFVGKDFSKAAGIGNSEDEIDRLALQLNAMAEGILSNNVLLRDSEAQVNTIFNNAPDAVVVMNEKGVIVRWNPAAHRLFGWHEDEVMGQLLHNILVPERYRSQHIAGLTRFLATGAGRILNRTVELPALCKDGSELDIELTISPAKLKEEYLFISFLRDITERKRAETLIRQLNTTLERRVTERTEELAESEKKYRSLFENNPIPLWVLDRATLGFLDVNESALEKYGYTREEFLSMNSANLRPEGEKKRYIELHRPPLGTQNAGVWQHLKKDGTLIYVEVIVHEIIFAGKQARLVLALDITERKKVENEILELNQKLEQRVAQRTEELQMVNRELESFSYSVSHDLRAPLRAINGYSQMIEEDYGPKLDKEAMRLLGQVKSNARKMGQLVDDLLSFSRMGKRDLMIADTDMNRLVDDAINELDPSDRDRTVFTIHSLPTARVDAALFHHVFHNLISNAVKYSSKKQEPLIEIGVRNINGKCVYFVKDNGAGFNMAYYDKLFGVFQRLHGQDEFEGTGVGLAIVQRIVVRHGGSVWAEAVENQGATFYFALNQSS